MALRLSPARFPTPQHLVTYDVTLDYAVNAAQLLAGLQIGSFPIGAKIIGTQINTVTALAGGTPAGKFGITLGGVELVASNAYAAAAIGGIVAPNTIAGLIDRLTAEVPIYYRDTGGATTAGKLIATFLFSIP